MDSLLQRMNTDAELKRRFLDDPSGILAEYGIAVPAGVTVLEDKEDLRHIVLPFVAASDKVELEPLEQRVSKEIMP